MILTILLFFLLYVLLWFIILFCFSKKKPGEVYDRKNIHCMLLSSYIEQQLFSFYGYRIIFTAFFFKIKNKNEFFEHTWETKKVLSS